MTVLDIVCNMTRNYLHELVERGVPITIADINEWETNREIIIDTRAALKEQEEDEEALVALKRKRDEEESEDDWPITDQPIVLPPHMPANFTGLTGILLPANKRSAK